MQVNNSVWDVYKPGYIDPLYEPYQKHSVYAYPELGQSCNIKLNSWARQGPPEMVYPELVRNGWGKSFQRMFSYDPCPGGWVKGPDNWCIEEKQEFTPIFYTDKAFIPKNQYWNSYAPQLRSKGRKWRSNYGYEDRLAGGYGAAQAPLSYLVDR